MKAKNLTLTMLAGFACLIFATATMAQVDDYQKVQKNVLEPVTFKDKGGTPNLWTGAVSPNSSATYNEVEDYTINPIPKVSNVWTGAFNKYWGNAQNWSLGYIPGAADDAVITSAGYQPVTIDYSDKACKNLTIESGEMLIKGYTLQVNGNLDIQGKLSMDNASGVMNVTGNVVWQSGSTADITAAAIINVYGNWNFNAGANANLLSGFVDFRGTTDNWIRSYSDNSSFYNLRIYKTGGAKSRVSWLSTTDLVINNLTFITSGAIFESHSDYNIVMKGSFNYYGTFDFTMNSNTGSALFSGNTQSINNYSSGSGTFNNVRINSTTKTTIVSAEVIIAKNLTINSGQLDAGANTIKIGGDWTNNAFPTGFSPGTGRVIFNGANHQYVHSSENFNILEADKGAALRITNPAVTVTCNQYDWKAGGIDVIDGTFTALDLAQDGIFGGYWVNPGATINLYQDGAQYVDLNGTIWMGGGNINVYGGSSGSYWSYAGDASVTMSGGTLDFKDVGIYVYNSGTYSFTQNITGGTIRTSGYVSASNNQFTPTGGIVEMYGTSDVPVTQSNGATFYDLTINKSSKEGNPGPSIATYEERDGEKVFVGGGSKANTVTPNTNITVTNNLEVAAGTLSLNTYTFAVAGTANITGNLSMTSGNLNVDNALRFLAGSTGNVTGGTINLKSWFTATSGSSFTASTANTMTFTGNLVTGMHVESAAVLFGNVTVDKTTWAHFLYADVPNAVVGGSFDLQGTSIFAMQGFPMHVQGQFTDSSGTWIILDESKKAGEYVSSEGTITGSGAKGGSLEIDSDFTLSGLMDLDTYGNVLVHGSFGIASTGVLTIEGTSTFIADKNYYDSDAWQNLYGTINMSGGLFEITNNSIRFSSTSVNNISGGTMRCGFAFYAVAANVFQPTGGVVELIGSNSAPYIECDNGNYFYDLTINRGNPIALISSIEVRRDMLIQSGELIAVNRTIKVGRNWTNNGGSAAFNEGTSTVTFFGSLSGDITTAETFYNLVLDKTYGSFDGLEIMSAPVTVLNNLNIIDGTLELNDNTILTVGNNVDIALDAGLNAGGVDTNLEIFVGGNWTNLNTTYNTISGYTPGGETITFNGAADQIMTTAAAIEDFNNFVVNKPGGALKPAGNLQILGSFDIFAGNFSSNTSGLTHYFHRNFTLHGPGNYHPGTNSTTVFKGALDQTFERLGGISQFVNVIVDKTAAKSSDLVEVSGGEQIAMVEEIDESKALTVNLLTSMVTWSGGTTTIEEGTLNLNGKNYKSTGAMNINAGGIVAVPAGSSLYPIGGLFINNGGILETIGTAGSNARVSHDGGTGYFPFEVNSGGTIRASYTRFQYMNSNGIYINVGAIVDATHSFHNCTFELGAPSPSALMVIHNNQTFSVNNAVFPTNTWGGQYNVWKMVDNGHVTFNNATGGYAGPAYEYDPYNRIEWSGFIPGLWTGTVSTNWFTAGNWSDGIVPVAGTNVVIPAGCPFFPVVNGAAAICNNLDINTGASLTIGNNSLTAAGTVDINGHLVMTNAAAVLNANQIWWNDGSSDNVTAGAFHAYGWKFCEGTNAMIGTGNTAYLITIYFPEDPDAEFGNLVVVPGSKIAGDESKAFYPCRVAGDFTMQDGVIWNNMLIDLIVGGNAVFDDGSFIRFHSGAGLFVDGATEIAGHVKFDVNSLAELQGEFIFPAGGWLEINNGTFTNYYDAESGFTNLNGKLTMNENSIVEFPGKSINISSTFVNEISGGTLRFGRSFRSTFAGNFQQNSGTIEFISSNIGHYIQLTNGNFANNMVINKPSGILTVHNDLILIGSLSIDAGILHANNKIIQLAGNWDNNAGSGAFSEGTSLVIFNGSGELNHQFINGNTTFYDLENAKTGSGYLRFAGNIAVTNDFLARGENMVDGPTLDVNNLLLSEGVLGLTAGAPIVTASNFTMGGTLSVTDGNFSCTDITNNGIFGTIHLYNGEITLNQVGDEYTDLNGALTIEGGNMTVNGVYGLSEWGWAAPASFTMTGGTLNFNNPGISIISPRNVTTSISGGTMRTSGHFWVTHPNFVPTGGTAELYGNSPAYVQSSGGSHFYDLTIDKPAGSLLSGDFNRDEEQLVAFQIQKSGKDRMVYELPAGRSGNIAYTNGNLKVVNNTVVEEGSLIIEYDASNSGDLTVNEGGKLSLLNLGSLAMGDTKALTVNSGGELSLQGNDTDFPKITRISGNYGLNIESGATIGADYAIFEHMNTAGVNVKPGATVDPVKAFANCIFQNGQSGGRLITINNNQTLLLSNVSFPGSTGNFNVSKTEDEGVVVLNEYSGAFAGASWEQDNYNRIHWTGEPSTDIILDGVVVGSYQDFCFEAIENITVGGSQNFVVEAFGVVNLVAGESILMLPGTHAQLGSYLHAQISDVSFCSGLPLALVAAMNEDTDQHDWFEINEEKTREGLFKVFPNPARDIITLELTPPAEDGHVIIEIYNLMGQNLMSKRMEAKPQYQIDLTGLQSGIYLIKVTHGKTPAFTKLVKQ
jgi:hypothetical protein